MCRAGSDGAHELLMSARDEADFLTVPFVSDTQAQPSGQLADPGLVMVTYRQQHSPKQVPLNTKQT